MSLDAYSSPPADPNAEQVLDPYPDTSARRTKLAVSWEQRAIARDLAPHLVGLTYVDNLTGAADELALELEDREDLWSTDWRPEYGDKAVARIEAQGWFGYGQKVNQLRLGTFTHDKIVLSGAPRRVSLQCISAPIGSALRRRKRTHAWRSVDLKQIADDIAKRAGLTLDFDGAPGSKYKSAVQNDKSDLEFLEQLCKEVGRTLKVTESTIAIYVEEKLDSAPAAGEIDLRGGNVLVPWSFEGSDSGRYGSCTVTFLDPRTGKKIKGQFPPDGVTVPGLDPNGQTLELTMAVSDAAEALERAKAHLRNANRFANQGKLTTIGDPGLVAGVTFDLTNAGGLSGKYIITKAEHRVGSGYVCALDVRRCVEGF